MLESNNKSSAVVCVGFFFKQVGKVTLHLKCAAARGGLHRYHPLVFSQPHLCQVDITLHMVNPKTSLKSWLSIVVLTYNVSILFKI